MKLFTYVFIQTLSAVAFLMESAWATFEPMVIRIVLIAFGAVQLGVAFKIMHDALGKLTIAEFMRK